jgi:predicted nucleotidyltransferase
VRQYLRNLMAAGLNVKCAVLFGSFARGDERQTSDIDLVVISPEFDQKREAATVELLWKVTGSSDDRIEPIPCGEKEWETDGSRPIIELARREGIPITL